MGSRRCGECVCTGVVEMRAPGEPLEDAGCTGDSRCAEELQSPLVVVMVACGSVSGVVEGCGCDIQGLGGNSYAFGGECTSPMVWEVTLEVTQGWGCWLSEWVRCVSAGDIRV